MRGPSASMERMPGDTGSEDTLHVSGAPEGLSTARTSRARPAPASGSRPSGLTEAEAARRLAEAGPNRLEVAPRPHWVRRFLANFSHLMALLLWAGGIVALLAGLPALMVAIWSVNLINGVFSFWQEYKAERATEALRRLLPSYTRVLRDGRERRILAEEVVPGDVLILGEGDHVPADARLTAASRLRVDESSLTGESDPVLKRAEAGEEGSVPVGIDVPTTVFAGTSVVAGAGTGVVTATGMATQFGTIARLTQAMRTESSPLQRELGRTTRVASVMAVTIGLAFFLLALLLTHVTPAESFIFAMGMIVAFIPEGLLPTVTLSLAMGVQRMAARHALIKRLSSVETLGSTSVICTDKTGTLTENQMTVRGLWLPVGSRNGAAGGGRPTETADGRGFALTGGGYAPEGQVLLRDRPVAVADIPDLELLLRAAVLCSNARLVPPSDEDPAWDVLGDPTEGALLRAATKAGLDLEATARRWPRLRELAFESQRRRMTTIHRSAPGGPGLASMGLTAYVKGAPRDLVALSARVGVDQHILALDDATRGAILAANDHFAAAGLRVLAVATRDLPAGVDVSDPAAVETDLTFLGLAAMMDPPRPEVARAVETCHHAGIRVIMVTGDYGLTAEGIARRIGILKEGRARILTGQDIDGLDEAALGDALAGEVIVARATPEHKLRVVAALQAQGNVVAVTGDGVNDAPALKKADIGVAMGRSGTDVAREAADMVLTDDNFASIVSAVEEGRAVFVNIKRFVTYIFTSNMAEAVPFVLFALSGGRIPLALTIMQVLAIDLGTDMVPALALGAEAPEPGVMDRPPRTLREHVVTLPLMARALLFLGAIASLGSMLGFFAHYWVAGYAFRWLILPAEGPLYRSATAMTLACVVGAQVGNLFAQRSTRESVFRARLAPNRLIWVGIAVELLFLLGIVYLPFLQSVFGAAAFPLWEWLFPVLACPLLLLGDELRKLAVRRRELGVLGGG